MDQIKKITGRKENWKLFINFDNEIPHCQQVVMLKGKENFRVIEASAVFMLS